jgi:hypothetical protein
MAFVLWDARIAAAPKALFPGIGMIHFRWTSGPRKDCRCLRISVKICAAKSEADLRVSVEDQTWEAAFSLRTRILIN